MPLSSFNWCVFGREEYLDTRKTGALLPVLCARSNTRIGFAAGVLHYHVARHLFNRDAHSFAEGDYVLRILDPQQFRGDYPFTVASRRQVDEGPAIPALNVEAPKSAAGLTEADHFLLEVADSCGFRQFEPNSNADITALRNEADEANAARVDMYVATGPQVVALIKRIEKGRDQPTLTQQDLVNEAMGLVDAMPEGPAKTWIKECHGADLHGYTMAAKHPFGAANSHIKTYGQAWATARESEIAKLRGLLFAARNENAELRTQLAAASKRADSAEAEYAEVKRLFGREEFIDAMRLQSEMKGNEIHNMKGHVAELNNKLAEARGQATHYAEHAARVEREVERLKDRLAEECNAVYNANSLLSETRGRLAIYTAHADSAEAEYAELRTQVAKLTDSQIEVTRLLVTANAKAATAQADRAAASDQLAVMSGRFDAMRRQSEERGIELHNVKGNVAEINDRLDSAKGELARVRGKYALASSQLDDAHAGLGLVKDKLAELETRAEKAEAALGVRVVDLARANERIADFQAMQPHWAKGYSSDGVAALCTAAQLSRLWELLGVNNQTEAMTALRGIMKAPGNAQIDDGWRYRLYQGTERDGMLKGEFPTRAKALAAADTLVGHTGLVTVSAIEVPA